MKKESLFFLGVALIVGLLIGVIIGNKQSGSPSSSPVANVAQTAPPVNHEQNIMMLKEVVAGDPQNRVAWVKLGNSYYDTNRFLEAIEAYDKALELDGNDPNVLTDQGNMFRQLGWFDKAVENFEKANDVAPNHAQSVFNAYVVYRQDLNDIEGAKKAALKYLKIQPNSQASAQLRADLEVMNSKPTKTFN
jgi:tetratricopeptide (TPR) repeat protein